MAIGDTTMKIFKWVPGVYYISVICTQFCLQHLHKTRLLFNQRQTTHVDAAFACVTLTFTQ